MAKASFVEFIISARDNATSVVNKLSSTFETARKNAAQFQNVAKGLPLTINDIKGEIAALEYKKGFAKTKDEIIKINTLLYTTKGQLEKLENLPPKGFIARMDNLSKSITGFSLKNIGFALFAQQSLQFVKGSTQLFDIQAQAEAQLQASITSTGMAAGRTFAELTKAASALQSKTIFGDEEIIRAQSILLTFTNIKGAVFDQAMPAIANLATKMGTDLNSAASQIGKALNAPVEGIAALRRAQVQFTDEQEKSIKRLVKEGDVQGAQYIMLAELQKQFGGSAEAAAKEGLGPIKQLAGLWADFREIIGKLTLSLINSVVPAFKSLVGWMTKNEDAVKIIGKVLLVAATSFAVYKGVMLASTLIKKGLTVATLIQKSVIFATTLATQGLTKAMLVLNGVSKANMFAALAGVAIAALTAFQLFRKKTDETAQAVQRAKEIGQDYYAKEKMNLDLIFEKLKRTNPASKERNKLVEELKQMYPELNKQLLDEVRNTNNLANAYDVLIGKIRAKSELKVREASLDAIASDIVKAEDELFRIATEKYTRQKQALVDGKFSDSKVLEKRYDPATGLTNEVITDRKTFEQIFSEMQNDLMKSGAVQFFDEWSQRSFDYSNSSYSRLKNQEKTILSKIADLQFGGTQSTVPGDPGDGTTDTIANPTHTYYLPGLYDVSLTVADTSTLVDSTKQISILITGNTSHSFSVTSCESYTSPSGNYFYATSGTYNDTIQNQWGCDSVLTMDVTINYSTTFTDVVTACDSYTWMDGVLYTASNNTAVFTLPNSQACDSIVTLNLTINQTPGTSVLQDGITLTAIANAPGITYQWLDCNNNMELLPGETGQSFTATVNGRYALEISENECIGVSDCYTVNSVGILANSYKSEMLLYPNPTNGKLYLEMGQMYPETVVKIYDVYGKLVNQFVFKNENKLELYINEVNGIYLMDVQSGNQKALIKVIKN